MNYSRTLYFITVLELMLRKLELLKKSGIEDFVKELANSIKNNISTTSNNTMRNELWTAFRSEIIYAHYCEKLFYILDEALSSKRKSTQKRMDLIKKIEELHSEISNSCIPRIKAAFFINEGSMWPSFESVWESFMSDNKCDPKLIYVHFKHTNQDKGVDNLKWYREMGYPVISAEDYDLSNDSPDIVFYLKPYDNIPEKYYIDAIDKYVKRVVYIPYGFEIAGGEQIITYQFRLPLQYKAWKIIGYSEHYKEMAKKYGYKDGRNVAVLGHPRLDKVEKFLDRKPVLPEEWALKIGKRKTVLWNTHFTIQPNVAWGTYMQWKDVVFNYFSAHKDIVLLWRPHPLFFGALKENGYMSETEISRLKDGVLGSDNIILDGTSDYRNSFYISDALISDGTSFLLEYLATEKPILYTPKHGGWGLSDENLVENYYIANREIDIVNFFEMVKKGEDPLYNARMNTLSQYLVNPDGKIGERVKQYLISEMEKEEIDAAHSFIDNVLKRITYSKRGI